MQEKSIRVLNMVRRTLLENPEVTDRALYAAAVSLDPSIGNLSLQQFQARYPRHVRRFELGPRNRRAAEPGPEVEELPVADRPLVYLPGRDTLSAGEPSARSQSGRAETVPEADASPADAAGSEERDTAHEGNGAELADRGRRVRRRSAPGAEQPRGSATGASPPDVAAAPAAVPPTGMREGADTTDPAAPWPLRLFPGAADFQPPRRPATKREGAEPAGRDPAPGTKRARVDRSAEDRARVRTEIRSRVLEWAKELSAAESRGELVGVLARAGDYADSIVDAGLIGSAGRSGRSVRRQQPSASTDGSGSANGTDTVPIARPDVPNRARIQDYRPEELDALVGWVASEQRHATEDAIVAAVIAELGFRRRGRRIDATIRDALARTRAASGEGTSGPPVHAGSDTRTPAP